MPKARTEGVLVRRLADETMVYDTTCNKAHCLNPTAAWVWAHCDGVTPVAELARLLLEERGLPRSEALVRLAVDQLAARGLLDGPVPADPARASRRDALKALSVAAAALPLVMTLSTRTARAGQTSVFQDCVIIRGSGIREYRNAGGRCVLDSGGEGVCMNGKCVAKPTTTVTNPPPAIRCGQLCSGGPCPTGCVCDTETSRCVPAAA